MNVHKDKSIAEHAAEWARKLRTPTTLEEREEYDHWVRQSPQHAHEMLLAITVDAELRLFFEEHRADAEELLGSAVNVHELGGRIAALTRDEASRLARNPSATHVRPAAAGPATRSKRSRWLVAAAACAVALFTGAIIAVQLASERGISTQAGEWEKKILPDHTIARIGPRTKLIVDFTEDRRIVRLIRGEALFYVTKDPARPFIVETELASAQAVGTAFAVSRYEPEQVRITVKEGRVVVARASYSPGRRSAPDAAGQGVTLNAGDEVVVTPKGTLTTKQVDLETALAWENVQLYFEHVTIEQAVREFNRRNKLQIKILDEALLKRHITGRFDASNPRMFGVFLEKHGAVAVMEEESGTLLIAPYPDPITIRADN